MKWRWRLKRIY